VDAARGPVQPSLAWNQGHAGAPRRTCAPSVSHRRAHARGHHRRAGECETTPVRERTRTRRERSTRQRAERSPPRQRPNSKVANNRSRQTYGPAPRLPAPRTRRTARCGRDSDAAGHDAGQGWRRRRRAGRWACHRGEVAPAAGGALRTGARWWWDDRRGPACA